MSARGQLRELGRPAERVRKTPNKRQFRCGTEDARLVPGPEVAPRSPAQLKCLEADIAVDTAA
jgi:hypothetical protein